MVTGHRRKFVIKFLLEEREIGNRRIPFSAGFALVRRLMTVESIAKVIQSIGNEERSISLRTTLTLLESALTKFWPTLRIAPQLTFVNSITKRIYVEETTSCRKRIVFGWRTKAID